MIIMNTHGQIIGEVENFEFSKKREEVIDSTLNKRCFKTDIEKEPSFEELLENSWLKNKKGWRNNKRLWAKFCNSPKKYLTKRAHRELLARALATPLCRRIDFESIARKCFSVEPLNVEV